MTSPFPKLRLTAADRQRLSDYSGNEQGTRAFLKTNPAKEDVQRMLLIELDRGWQVRNVILDRLLKRLFEIERSELVAKFDEYRKGAVK
jgi:hypothetical protein